MRARPWWVLGVWGLALGFCAPVLAQLQTPFVRWVELEIDPTQLEGFRAAAAKHREAALRTEPGILALHTAAERGRPTRFRVLEMYADAAASQTHLQAPHFMEFRATTDRMVTSRKVQDTTPVVLGAKPRLPEQALVRIAELEIAPAQLPDYKAAVTEEIEDSIRLETGVLAIYAVSVNDNPTQLRFFEIYADDDAYKRHIASPHFRKYVDVTKAMISSRRLFETESVMLGQKSR